jgi:hypothetical protein
MVASAGSWRPALNSFFVVFVHHLYAPGQPVAYKGHDRKVVIYATGHDAEAIAAKLTINNKNPNISFTVTEFQLARVPRRASGFHGGSIGPQTL